MPTIGLDLYHMQDTRNNFDAMRPAPICADANQFMGQCQNVHISTNCYYGYHGQKSAENPYAMSDCEMADASAPPSNKSPVGASASPLCNARKRSADDAEIPMTKRFREDDTSITSLDGTRSCLGQSTTDLSGSISKNYELYLTVKLIFTVTV